jgi:hypothetical protein
MAVTIDSTLHRQFGVDISSSWQLREYPQTVMARIKTTVATITTIRFCRLLRQTTSPRHLEIRDLALLPRDAGDDDRRCP